MLSSNPGPLALKAYNKLQISRAGIIAYFVGNRCGVLWVDGYDCYKI